MNKLFEFGNEYAENSDWTDYALTKLCLCSMGVVIGANLPEKCRKPATIVSCGLFAASYVTLMSRVFRLAKDYINKDTQESDDDQI